MEAVAEPTESPQPNLLKGRYHVKSRISQGTYGKVYIAFDHVANENVALKKIIFHDQNEGYPYTAVREIGFIKKLDHPNIVKIKDVISEPCKLNIVFECLKCDLAHRLKETSEPPLTKFQVKTLLHQLLLGMAEVHARRIIHRDIKPMNLLLSEAGVLKIADFGLARGMSLPDRTYTEEVATLYYRAPEVILMQRYSTEMDIWSIGCVFYEMVTGKCLFQGDSPVDQIHRILRALGTPTIEEWPDIIRSRNPDISSANLPKYPKQKLHLVFPDLPLEPAGYDLLELMLEMNPKNRISAAIALTHAITKTDARQVATVFKQRLEAGIKAASSHKPDN